MYTCVYIYIQRASSTAASRLAQKKDTRVRIRVKICICINSICIHIYRQRHVYTCVYVYIASFRASSIARSGLAPTAKRPINGGSAPKCTANTSSPTPTMWSWVACRKAPSVARCVAVCCSVLQCVALCCSVLQCAAVCCAHTHTQAHTHTRLYIHTRARAHTHTHIPEGDMVKEVEVSLLMNSAATYLKLPTHTH